MTYYDNDTFRRAAAECGMKVRFAWLPVNLEDGRRAWWQLVAYRREQRGYRVHARGAYATYRNVYYGGARISAAPSNG